MKPVRKLPKLDVYSILECVLQSQDEGWACPASNRCFWDLAGSWVSEDEISDFGFFVADLPYLDLDEGADVYARLMMWREAMLDLDTTQAPR